MDALSDLINELSKIPGLGPKAASRMCFYLLGCEDSYNKKLGGLISSLKTNIHKCPSCGMFTDSSICSICSDKERDESILAIVENTADVLSIENSTDYNGYFHILGGRISPINGIYPEMLNIATIKERIDKNGIREIIFALNPSAESDITADYIKNSLEKSLDKNIFSNLIFSKLSTGLSFGSDIGYATAKTLNSAIENRVKF